MLSCKAEGDISVRAICYVHARCRYAISGFASLVTSLNSDPPRNTTRDQAPSEVPACTGCFSKAINSSSCLNHPFANSFSVKRFADPRARRLMASVSVAESESAFVNASAYSSDVLA